MDPQERKSVYINRSTIPSANEGIFARYQNIYKYRESIKVLDENLGQVILFPISLDKKLQQS